MPAKLKPATPRHPKHDSACPFCGEPFMAARFGGYRIGEYDCARCGGSFVIIAAHYYDLRANKLADWVGAPLPGGQ